MTRRSSAPLLLALAAGVSPAAGARADETRANETRADETREEVPSTIAVLCAPGDRFGLRVVAELESLGFRVELLDPAAEPVSRASLEASARQAGAIAAIRAIPSGRGVEVWIADRVTGKTVLREMASRAGDGGAEELDDAALALRVVELLRASLLEASLPEPPPGELPATPEIREKLRVPAPSALADAPAPAHPQPAPAHAQELHVSLAPGVLLSPGGLGAAVSADLGLAWMPSEHVGVVAFAAIPLTSARHERPDLSVDLSALLVGGGVRFTPRARRWAPSADLGLAALSLRTAGLVAGADATTGESSAVTVAPFTRLGLAFAVTPWLRLRADVLTGAIVQGVSVQIEGNEIATWGRPFLLSSAGVYIRWF
ncbi:hypothetical protein SOCE26_079720 [Sorangium cellulosum]|uniref:Secreted protein n=1 Tax=Sorangium cellulosum TaxID=56 RepID=A0A2L0F4J8_SORCE|nr:hypothetical protein [Sorangium cellulosum]AUX46466.1 hypothetical protein SOCE26_079720 [Sorangium cellulosum]